MADLCAAPPADHVVVPKDDTSTIGGFSSRCLSLLQQSTSDWVFARITSVPTPKPDDEEGVNVDQHTVYNHYYGFAEEIWPSVRSTPSTPRNIWFKLATHTKEGILVGPVKFGTPHYTTLPSPGEVVVGKVVHNVHRHGYRFEWWCRDAQPLMNLVRIFKYGTSATKDALCMQSRILSSIQLDNLWAFIRLVAQEDLQSFVSQYYPVEQQTEHPIRGEHGPRGYVLDRSPHRFVMDVSKVCNCPAIYTQFLQMVHSASALGHVVADRLPSEEAVTRLGQELMDLEDSTMEESFATC
jgi:hypothetical protein